MPCPRLRHLALPEAGPVEPESQVRVLEVEKEPFVETADRVEGRTTDEETGGRKPTGANSRFQQTRQQAMVPPCFLEPVAESLDRLAKNTHRRRPHELPRPVRVVKRRRGHPEPPVGLQRLDQTPQGYLVDPCVRVQEQQMTAGRPRRSQIAPGAEAEVAIRLDESNRQDRGRGRLELADRRRRTVNRRVVDHHGLQTGRGTGVTRIVRPPCLGDRQEALQAPPEPVTGVVVHDQSADRRAIRPAHRTFPRAVRQTASTSSAKHSAARSQVRNRTRSGPSDIAERRASWSSTSRRRPSVNASISSR